MALDVPKEAIRALVASLSGIHPARVFWKGEPEKHIGPIAGQAGKITLNIVAIEEGDGLEARREYNEGTGELSEEWGVTELLTISLRADNFLNLGEAYNLLRRMRFRFPLPEPRAQMRLADLAYVDSPSIVNLDYVVDTRDVSSASMDVRFSNVISTDPQAVSFVEKVTSQAGPFSDAEAEALPVVSVEIDRDG